MIKGAWNYLKNFIRKVDQFGTSFSFKYKSEEKYSTYAGGIISLLFYIILIIYFGLNLVPFINKEIFTLQFYTMNLNETEEIKLKDSKTAFAFGLTCNKIDKTKEIRDLFDLKLSFMNQRFINDTSKNTTSIDVKTHNCKYEDFYNLHNDSFKTLNIEDLQCIEQNELNDHQLKGIYSNKEFTYYRFIVSSKNKTEKYFKKINNFLIQNDCKLQLYYTDISANLSNFKKPITSYINSLFLQLSANLIQEKNVFFMNYHLYNESKFVHIFENDKNPNTMVGFSRVEDYSLYKGLNEDWNTSYDYEKYAKLYVRVDNKKVVIKRKYQDFMEFYADNTLLLLNLFEILCLIFSFYDKLRANHSITKKLFFYEGIEQNQFEELKKIKDILYSTKEKDKEIKIFNKTSYKDSNSQRDNTPFQSRPSSSKKLFKNNYVSPGETESNSYNITNQSKGIKFIKYNSYAMHEMILELLPSYCKTKNFKYKEKLIRESHSILDNKLDVFLYIRNMLLFDSINKIYLENKSIINFLSRPIIYLNKSEKKEKETEKETEKEKEKETETEDEIEEIEEIHDKEELIVEKEFYKYSYKLDSEVLINELTHLCEKPGKSDNEKDIISSLKKKLKGV